MPLLPRLLPGLCLATCLLACRKAPEASHPPEGRSAAEVTRTGSSPDRIPGLPATSTARTSASAMGWMPIDGLVVLGPAPEGGCRLGPPERVDAPDGTGIAAVVQDLDPACRASLGSGLPDTAWSWDGEAYVPSRLGPVQVLSLFVPHMVQREAWHRGEEGQPPDPEAIAQDIARSGTHLLAARIENTADAFPTFRKPPAPPLGIEEDPSGERIDKVLEAEAALPEFLANQASFEENGGTGPWWQDPSRGPGNGAGQGKAHYELPTTDGSHLLWLVHSGGEPCSPNAWDLTTLWRVGPKGRPELLWQSSELLTPLKALEAAPGALPEFVLTDSRTRRLLLRHDGIRYRIAEEWSYADQDCGC